MTHDLPAGVSADKPDLDVAELATRFRAFEALHDGVDICTPLSAGDLDRVAELLGVEPGHRVLDVACGHGAMLRKLAYKSEFVTGIDLSPWAARRAAEELERQGVRASVILGDAAHLAEDPIWDRVVCLGAGWIFHGFTGTCRALSRRLRPGGRLAIGDLRLRPGANAPGGRVPDAAEQRLIIESLGGRVLGDVVSGDNAWSDYGAAVLAAADHHRRRHPADAAADQRALARQWVADAERDRAWLDFAVVVAEFE